jgi:hypothetical protein
MIFIHSRSWEMRSVNVLEWVDRVAVMGEVGQAHDGSLGTAPAYIDAIADVGAAGLAVREVHRGRAAVSPCAWHRVHADGR